MHRLRRRTSNSTQRLQRNRDYSKHAMMERNLRILQLSIMKSRAAVEALINDSQTRHLDIILIQEPLLSAFETHVHHQLRHLYHPTYSGEAKIRSLIYVNKRITKLFHQQVACDHPDIMAIRVGTGESLLLIVSTYVQPLDIHHLSETQTMQPTLLHIEETIQGTIQATQQPTELIVSGDFNRHHPAWSG